MGTTRIKVIDLSSEKQEIKTSRKHAEKLSGLAKIKETKKPKVKKERAEEKIKAQEETKDSEISTQVSSTPPAETEHAKTQPQKTTKKKIKAHQRGVKYLTAAHLIEKEKIYPFDEAFDLLLKTSFTKFDPTVEAHLNVAVKNLQGSVNFPHHVTSKKTKKYLIFADEKPQVAKGKEIIWGNEKTIAEIEDGKLKPQRDFDVVLSTPKFMPQLAKIAKILGPRQMMPNPKNGTIIDKAEKVLEMGDKGLYEYKSDPSAPVIHTKIGKLSEKPQNIKENLKALITTIGQAKIKKVTLATTMSPSVKIDIATI